MKKLGFYLKTLAVLPLAVAAVSAQASLLTSDSYVGNYAVSTDGWGGTDGVGVISASVMGGSNIAAAYLYSTNVSGNSIAPSELTFGGTNITTFANLGTNDTNLTAFRSDVTSIVQSAIGAGGGIFDFDITEGSQRFSIDGHALVVVYENAALPQASVGILDGFSDSAGDSTSINFSTPLSVSDPGFFAEMSLGIGYSANGQSSTVSVNGNVLTTNAGSNDDGEDLADGSLITVGGFDDLFSVNLPDYASDSERYNLAASGFLNDGDSNILIDTLNPSRDDNIFLATFYVSGVATFTPEPTPVPVPATALLMLAGLCGLGAKRHFKKA